MTEEESVSDIDIECNDSQQDRKVILSKASKKLNKRKLKIELLGRV